MTTEAPTLPEVLSLEAPYVESGQPVLGASLRALKQRWGAGHDDRETALRLMFLLWFACREPDELTGLPEPGAEDSVLFDKLFERLGGLNATDPEAQFVLWWMAYDAPYCCGRESEWSSRGGILQEKLRAAERAYVVTKDEILPGGAYNKYFGHIVNVPHPALERS